MQFIVRLTTAVVGSLLISIGLGWHDPYYIASGKYAALLAGVLIIALLWVTRPRKNIHPKAPAENPVRDVLVGVAANCLWVGAMLLYFLVLAKTPALRARILDRDRAENDRVIGAFVESGNYREAARVILKIRKSVHSPEYAQRLAEDSILYLTRAAEQGPPKEASAYLNAALEIADEHELPRDLPESALKRLAEKDSLSAFEQRIENAEAESESLRGELAAKHSEYQGSLQAELERARREGDAILAEALKAAAEFTLSQAVAFCSDAKKGNLGAARTRLSQLIDVVRNRGISTEAAESTLRELDAFIASLLPAALSPGASARLLRFHRGVMSQVVVLDIAVSDQARNPLLGLTSRDFVASQAGSVRPLHASPISETRALNVLVLFDVSVSTEGAPITASRAAGPELISRLPSAAVICVASFSDSVKPLCDWTSDRSSAIAACKSLKASGGTALFGATSWGVANLRGRSGERVLVIFSDGANSIPGLSVDEIVRAAREAQVAVYFVALRSAGYNDTAPVEQIARETGGETFLVARADELVSAFGTLAGKLSETGYRLGLLNCDPTKALEFQIGGENAIRLSIPPSEIVPSDSKAVTH